MRITFGRFSARLLLNAVVLSGAAALVAVGCGGSSGGGGSSNGGTGGSSGSTATGGDTSTAGTTTGGTTSGGSNSTGGSSTAGEAGALGEGGEAGAPTLPPPQNTSATAFVSAGTMSTSKNFILLGTLGEPLGGTVGSKQSKSLKYTYIPGVIAGTTP
ncbi:MAG TPA: hypothetical protein VHV51_18680 [Polyangiaceae bacterium]|jgi:hypothetical protein|nr:hypothetical protein [Polyangiaceae bacterium]